MLDNVFEMSMLYDFYGDLLPQKQKEILGLYYGDNLSLSEIAVEYNLTRQGIHETLKRSERKLRNFESKLKLIEKFFQEEEIIKSIKEDIEHLIVKRRNDRDLVVKLKEFKDAIVMLNG